MNDNGFRNIKIMTYNIGGGRKDFGSNLPEVTAIVNKISPDILAIQESTVHYKCDEKPYKTHEEIADQLGYPYSYFGPALSMKKQFHVNKSLFVQMVFEDYLDWCQGNALISRWPFVKFGDNAGFREPYNIPLYKPATYEGGRDSEPRYANLACIDLGSIRSYVLNTHLTTLFGERGGNSTEIPGKKEQAETLRLMQCQFIIKLISENILEMEDLLFLVGDLNAKASEACIENVLEQKGGLVRLIPDQNIPTHKKIQDPIDHILVFPGKNYIEYKCWVEDNAFEASDHNPVVADLKIFGENTNKFNEYGPGIVRKNYD